RPLTGRATFGVGFANDDGRVLQLGKRRDEAEALVNRAQLVRDAHAHVIVGVSRRALRVEGNEIERRADLAGGVIRAAQAMLEKVARPSPAAARRVRPADARGGERAAR